MNDEINKYKTRHLVKKECFGRPHQFESILVFDITPEDTEKFIKRGYTITKYKK